MFDNDVLNPFLLISANDNKGKELNATFETSIAPVQTIDTTSTFHQQTQTVVFFHWLMVFHWSQSTLSSAFWDHLETYFLVCLAITANPPLRRASNYLLFSLALIVTLVCEPLILEFISNLIFFHVSETSSAHTSCLTQQLSVHVDAGLTIKPGWSSTTRNYILAMNRADVDAQKFR